MLKAEFHDIGKSIDWRALEKGGHVAFEGGEPHEFQACIATESERTAWGVRLGGDAWASIVLGDEFRELREQHFPGSRAWALTWFADRVAAGYSRPMREDGGGAPDFRYHCLWTGKTSDADRRFTDVHAVREMIVFLNEDPSFDQAVEKYGDALRARAESAYGGIMNVTTLLSHCRVVGKIARVLDRMDWSHLPAGGDRARAKDDSQRCKLIAVHGRIGFFQQPYRARDLGVFDLVRSTLEGLASRHPDEVLDTFENEFLAIFESTESRDAFSSEIADTGLSLTWRTNSGTVQDLCNQGLTTKVLHAREFVQERPTPDERIAVPLCESCRKAGATRVWPADPERRKTEPSEDLCQACYEIRERATPLVALSEWQSRSVAWIRLHLDLAALTLALPELHSRHIGERMSPGVPDVAYPMVVDFLADYRALLCAVDEDLSGQCGERNVQGVAEWLWCVWLEEDESQVLPILDMIEAQVRKRFPKLVASSGPHPIRVAVSVSNAKHPFFAHWRVLEEPPGELVVDVVGSGVAKLPHRSWEPARDRLSKVSASTLHRFSSIANRSQRLALAAARTKEVLAGDDERKLLDELAQDIGFESLRVLSSFGEPRNGERDDG